MIYFSFLYINLFLFSYYYFLNHTILSNLINLLNHTILSNPINLNLEKQASFKLR